jgi:hypothetical protein
MFALGFRIKSGRAIVVALGGTVAAPAPLFRAVVALSDANIPKTTQPFHDGFGTAQQDEAAIGRLTVVIQRCAAQSIDELLKHERLRGHQCRRAGLVVGSVIDPAQVGNLHIRAHANEGRLFRTVVQEALRAHGIDSLVIVEKQLAAEAASALRRGEDDIKRTVGDVGRAFGGSWRADEKGATIAAWMALA